MSMDFAPVIDAVKSTRPIIFDKALASSVKMKGEADFVTEVDLRISEHLKRQLGALHPEIGFMSEEEEPGELARRRWILDPIDGTTNRCSATTCRRCRWRWWKTGAPCSAWCTTPSLTRCFAPKRAAAPR